LDPQILLKLTPCSLLTRNRKRVKWKCIWNGRAWSCINKISSAFCLQRYFVPCMLVRDLMFWGL